MTMTFNDPTYLEAVYAALFSLLKAATFAGGVTLKTTSRSTLIPDNIPVADQPALYMLEGPMHVEQKQLYGLAKWTLTAVALPVTLPARRFAERQKALFMTPLE